MPKKIDELKEENVSLQGRLQERSLAQVNDQMRMSLGQDPLMETASAWGGVVDRREPLRDDPSFMLGGIRMSLPGNRKDGDFYPHFRSEMELQRIRGAGQWIGQRHPLAIGLLDDLTNYTISTGYRYTMSHKEHSILDDKVLLECQEVVDEFNERIDEQSAECSFERELFKRSREAGEFFAVVEHLRDGFSGLRIAEPEWVTAPKNTRQINMSSGMDDETVWRYGIASKKGNPNDVRGYMVIWNGEPENYRVHLPEEVIHAKLNVPTNVKRGLSDFYGVETYLEDQAKLLRNTARGAAIQAAIALIREHQPGLRGAEVERLSGSKVDATFTPPALPGGTVRQRRLRAYDEGTVLDVVGSKYYPGPLGAPHGQTFVEIGQAVIRVIGARWSLPEHMISNAMSGAGGARAALIEMGTPFARATKVRQEMYSKYYRKLMWQVLKIASFHGRVSAHIQQLRESFVIKVGVPEATQRNEAEQHLVLSGRQQARYISVQRVREVIGEDHETEEMRIQQEEQEAMNRQQEQALMGAQVQAQTQAMIDPLHANGSPDQGRSGQEANGASSVGRQLSAGSGADSVPQMRGMGVRNAKQSIRQKLAAGRAGKQVAPIGENN